MSMIGTGRSILSPWLQMQRCCSISWPATAAVFLGQITTLRWKHSKRQIKRLLAPHHPAYIRKHGRPKPKEIPPPQFQPIGQATLLPNGWSKPLDPTIPRPQYPFSVARTKNKPKDAVGFLPVYSKLRKDGTKVITRIKKVSGDREAFLQEVKSVLQTSKPVRISVGGTIEIPGSHVTKVKKWLTSLGF